MVDGGVSSAQLSSGIATEMWRNGRHGCRVSPIGKVGHQPCITMTNMSCLWGQHTAATLIQLLHCASPVVACIHHRLSCTGAANLGQPIPCRPPHMKLKSTKAPTGVALDWKGGISH